MSADGDTVRWTLAAARACVPERKVDDSVVALARLEAAEASCLYEFGRANDAEDAAHEHEVAAVHFAEKLKTAEAQRDALAKALRRLADCAMHSDPATEDAIEAAYAALVEAGLE